MTTSNVEITWTTESLQSGMALPRTGRITSRYETLGVIPGVIRVISLWHVTRPM